MADARRFGVCGIVSHYMGPNNPIRPLGGQPVLQNYLNCRCGVRLEHYLLLARCVDGGG